MASSEDDNEEDIDEDLVTLLKQKNWSKISIMTSSQRRPRVKSPPRWQLGNQPLPHQQPPHLRSRTALRNNASSSYRLREIDVRGQKLALCSIPEDGQTSRMLLFCPDDEDEPIYHRSPVTLDNGYRPRGRQIDSNGSLVEEEGGLDGFDESDNSSSTDFDDEDEEETTGRKITLWRLLALMIYLLRCLMIALFVAVVFVVFVLLTHDPPPLKSQTGYSLDFF